MKKFFIVLLAMLAAAGVGCSVYLYIQYRSINTERETLAQQNAELQKSIDAIGPMATAYTVAAPVTTRDVVHAGDFVEISMPASNMTEDVVTDLSVVDGSLYKVDIAPGTVLTKSLVMQEEYSEAIYEADLTFDYLPLGLEVGDYVNIKVSFPFGQTFIVTSHIRVDQVVQESNVIKTHLTAAQEELWTSVRKDYALYHNKGLSLYLEKYVEPGVDDEIVAFYPVRSEMEAVVNVNPNIADASICVNSKLRSQIDYMLEAVSDADGSNLGSGVAGEASAINGAADAYVKDDDVPGVSGSNNIASDTIDLNKEADKLSNAAGALQNETGDDQEGAESGSIFGDEAILN